jgi:hypothetical protein
LLKLRWGFQSPQPAAGYPRKNNQEMLMKTAKCPARDKVFQLQEETKVQELISCPHCISLLQLIRQFPPTLDWAEDQPVLTSQRTFKKLY